MAVTMRSFTRALGCVLGVVYAASMCKAAVLDAPIRVDQAGYLPDLPKLAIVVQPPSEHPATAFTLNRSNDKKTVFTGALSAPIADPDSGDAVQYADFSSVHDAGEFYIDVPRLGRSWNFAIQPNVYNHVYYVAARAFYGQRCGAAIDMGPDFPQYKHAICHTDGHYDPSSGKQGPHASLKGWHDAGDYGRYVVISGISTATLLWAWELYHDRIRNVG